MRKLSIFLLLFFLILLKIQVWEGILIVPIYLNVLKLVPALNTVMKEKSFMWFIMKTNLLFQGS